MRGRWTEWSAGSPKVRMIYRRAESLNSLLWFRNSHLSPCKMLFWRFTRHCILTPCAYAQELALTYQRFSISSLDILLAWQSVAGQAKTAKRGWRARRGLVTSSRATILRFTRHETNIAIIDILSRLPVRVIAFCAAINSWEACCRWVWAQYSVKLHQQTRKWS